MKALQEQTWDTELHRLEADLGARIETLFDHCPMLCGFSVGQRPVPPMEQESGVSESELFIAGIDVYPALGRGQSEQLCHEISSALVELLDEHPEAADLLSGRTFARTLH